MKLHSLNVGVACCLAMHSLLHGGCGDVGPQRAAVEGEVTVGGQPLKSGRILFLPVPPTVGPATSLVIARGTYRSDRGGGPLVGSHRVELEATLELGFALEDEEAFVRRAEAKLPAQLIPPEFNRQSRLTATIEDGQANRYDVTIPATSQSAGSSSFSSY